MSGKFAGQQQQCDTALWDTRGRRRTCHPKWCITRSLWWIWVITIRAEIQGTDVDFLTHSSLRYQVLFSCILVYFYYCWWCCETRYVKCLFLIVIIVNLLLLLLLFSLSLNSCIDTPGNLWQEGDMAGMNKSSKVCFHFTKKDEKSVCCNVCKSIILSQGWKFQECDAFDSLHECHCLPTKQNIC